MFGVKEGGGINDLENVSINSCLPMLHIINAEFDRNEFSPSVSRFFFSSIQQRR